MHVDRLTQQLLCDEAAHPGEEKNIKEDNYHTASADKTSKNTKDSINDGVNGD